jgi:hypothetical protein
VGWFDDVVDFVGDAADAVTEVASDVVNGVADAVAEIPVVGDVVEAAAPLAGMIGTVVGGPIGGAIGGVVSDAFSADGFGGGGGMFDFVDDAIGAIGGPLLGPIGGVAGDLLGGGSLIDAAGSVLTGGLSDLGGLGDLAGQVLGGGDLGDLAGQVLGGGGLGDLAGQVLGGGDLGDLAGQVLGGGGLGSILGQAGSVLGGLGLGDLGSAAQGIIGDCMPDLSDPGGWLGNLPDAIPGVGGGGGFELPFGMGTFPSIPDLTGPISAAGGDWLQNLAQQAGQVADQLPGLGGGWFESLGNNLEDTIAHVIDPATQALGQGAAGSSNVFDQPGDFGTSIDDLIGQLPGMGDGEGSVQEKLQQLAENGNLGDALGNLSGNELTQLVSHLVGPATPLSQDDMTIDGRGMDQATKDVVFGGQDPDDVLGPGTDDLGLDTGTDTGLDLGTTGTDAPGAVQMPTPDAGAGDDLSIDMPGSDLGAPQTPGPVEMPAPPPAPEPEPSDFSQAIAAADAVEESFDDMFGDLG